MKNICNGKFSYKKIIAIGLLLSIVITGFFFRQFNIHSSYFHPDEEIPVKTTLYMKNNHTLDTNMANIEEFPDLFKRCGYNFSSYIMSCFAVERAFDLVLPESYDKDIYTAIFLRYFSLLFGMINLVFIYLICKKHFTEKTAVAAALLYSITLLAVQDSHYARIENFLVFFILIMVYFILDNYHKRSHYYIFAFLLGILLSGKVTMAIFGLLFLESLYFYYKDSGQKLNKFIKSKRILSLLAISAICFACTLFLSMPFAFFDFAKYISSVLSLKDQYTGGHIPHCSPTGDLLYPIKSMSQYLWASLGPASLLPFSLCFFKKQWNRKIFMLASMCIVYFAAFSFVATFFERNLSMIIPLFIILSAIGLDLATDRYFPKNKRAVYIAILILVSIVPAINCYKFSVLALRPNPNIEQTETKLLKDYDRDGVLTCCVLTTTIDAENAAQTKGDRVLIRIISYMDGFTYSNIAKLKAKGFKEVGRISSIFSNFPTCTLHTYHSCEIIYLIYEKT